MKIVVILGIFTVLLTAIAAASLSCSVTTSCSHSTILRLSGSTNAHAELSNETNYNNRVCCQDTGYQSMTIGSSCTGTPFLKLSSSTDAHVEKTTGTAYSVNACISSPDATFTCGYQSNNCDGWDTCVASISGDTDAHIASCDSSPYTTRVCCSMEYNNDPPEITAISFNPNPVKGGSLVTITPSGVSDAQSDTLSLYCAIGNSQPTSANTACVGGTTTGDSPYGLSCQVSAPVNDLTHTVYCRVYDGEFYSSAVSGQFTSDSTPPPAVSIQNVDGDTTAPYWDTSDNSQTIIQATKPEAGMLCRWSTSDVTYSSISSANECSMGAETTQCNLGNLAQALSYTYHISCRDAVGNEQSTSQNTQVTFGVDWTEPTTSISGYGSYYLPGHEVTINESDNVADTTMIVTYTCHPTSGCNPVTLIDHLDKVAFTNRGTNYIRWYSIDAAGNTQEQQEVAVEINSLPVVDDSKVYSGIGAAHTGKHGQRVMFYCMGTDANGIVDGNQGYSAKIYLRDRGQANWNIVTGQTMTWSAVDNRFQFDHLLSRSTDIYGAEYDMMCELIDDLSEGTNHTKNSIFSVVNTAPNVDDIFANETSASKYDTVRFYCIGADVDTPVHHEAMFDAWFWLRVRDAEGWPIMDSVTMQYDGVGHYVDYQIMENGGSDYDAKCMFSDGVDNSTLGQALWVENFNISDDWDGDGIPDSIDTIEGTGADINTALLVTVLVDGEVLDTASGARNVTFVNDDTSEVFLFFTNDFSVSTLNMPLITIEKSTEGKGGILVRGLSGISKTLHAPKIIGTGQICVKNAEATSIDEITLGCTGPDEIFFNACNTGGQTLSDITCKDRGTYYEVSGLMNSAVTEIGNARLEIDSVGSYLQLDDILFWAHYTNATSSAIIADANCEIHFDDSGWNQMDFNTTHHTFSRAFTGSGLRYYNVSCTHADYDNINLQDSFTISMSAIPEFSTITLIGGLVAVLIGLVIIRKRRH